MANYFWVGGTGTWSGTGNTQFAVTSGGVATLLNPTNADTVTFDANSGTAATVTCTSTAVSLSTTINKSDINLSLSGSPTLCTAAGTCTLTAGTLTLNTFTLSTGLFSSSNSNTRVLAFGTGKIVLTGVSTTIFNTTTVTGMTITGTPVVDCTATTGTSVQTRIFISGAHGESQSISVNINPGTSAVDIFRFATNSGAFKDVTFSSTFTGTIQISNTIIFYGSVTFGGATVYTGNSTLTFAATSGTKTISTSSLAIDAAITFSGVGGTWQLQGALTSGATRTCTLTAGTLDLNNYTLTTGAFNSNNSNARTLAFGTGSITLTGNAVSLWNTNVNTNLVVTGTPVVNCTYSGSTGTRAIAGSTSILEAYAITFNIAAAGDTVNLQNYLFKDIIFDAGFTGTFSSSSVALYGNLNLGNATSVSGTSLTFVSTSGTKTITSNGKTMDFPVSFNGIGGTWACQDALTLGSTRALTFTNGTLQLKSGTTNTVGSFVTTGTTLKYLQSTTPGTQATISDASGTNTVTYLSVQDSNATGGATWDATATSNIYVTNNTGWNFGTLAALSGVSATGGVGSLVCTIPVSLSGVQATGTVGSVGFANAYTLSGVAATGAVESTVSSFTISTTGVQATSSVGSVGFGNAYALSSVLATGAVGSVKFANAYALSGVQANGAVGNLYPGWYVIPNTQTPSWTNISTTQTPSWTNIIQS